MKKVFLALMAIAAIALTGCKESKNEPTPDPQSSANVGTYLWGEDLYSLGTDGAKTLAEMYAKTNIKTVYLLVKGTKGTVGFLANPAGEYKLAREDRDILQEVTTAMHAKDIKVYAWIYCSEDAYYGENHPSECCYHFRNGTKGQLPDMNSTDFIAYLARMIQVIRANYQVDGIMFDHLRYNGLYYGWGDKDFEAMTTDPAIGMSLDEYNEVVKLMAATYNYPIAKNDKGRYVYNLENPEIQENIPNAIFNAANQGNKAVAKLMKYRELTVDRISIALLKECSGTKTMYASMPEVVTDPKFATLSYGTTINDTYLFDVVSPMLYSKDFGADAAWVKKGCDFLLEHKYNCIPSLQAYGTSTTATLAEDIAAAVSAGCKDYNLFQSCAYDIARVTAPANNQLRLQYLRGAKKEVGSITVNVSDASKIQNITLGGVFSGVQYTLNGNTLTIAGDNLKAIGNEGIITFELTEKIGIEKVESDNIVWMDKD